MLLLLPDDVLYLLLIEWLYRVEDLLSFDSALCNQQLREKYLALLARHPTNVFKSYVSLSRPSESIWTFDWLKKRNISIIEVMIFVERMVVDFIDVYRVRDYSTVQLLHIDFPENMGGSQCVIFLDTLLISMPQLINVHISVPPRRSRPALLRFSKEFEYDTFPTTHPLKKIELINVKFLHPKDEHALVTPVYFKVFTKCCQDVETIRFIGCGNFHPGMLLHALARWHHVTELEYVCEEKSKWKITSKILTQLINNRWSGRVLSTKPPQNLPSFPSLTTVHLSLCNPKTTLFILLNLFTYTSLYQIQTLSLGFYFRETPDIDSLWTTWLACMDTRMKAIHSLHLYSSIFSSRRHRSNQLDTSRYLLPITNRWLGLSKHSLHTVDLSEQHMTPETILLLSQIECLHTLHLGKLEELPMTVIDSLTDISHTAFPALRVLKHSSMYTASTHSSLLILIAILQHCRHTLENLSIRMSHTVNTWQLTHWLFDSSTVWPVLKHLLYELDTYASKPQWEDWRQLPSRWSSWSFESMNALQSLQLKNIPMNESHFRSMTLHCKDLHTLKVIYPYELLVNPTMTGELEELTMLSLNTVSVHATEEKEEEEEEGVEDKEITNKSSDKDEEEVEEKEKEVQLTATKEEEMVEVTSQKTTIIPVPHFDDPDIILFPSSLRVFGYDGMSISEAVVQRVISSCPRLQKIAVYVRGSAYEANTLLRGNIQRFINENHLLVRLESSVYLHEEMLQ